MAEPATSEVPFAPAKSADEASLPSVPAAPVKPPAEPAGAANEANIIDQLPRNVSETLICPICLDTFSDAVVLNCGHSYCFRCISLHMQRQDSCPADRVPISLLTRNMALRQLIDQVRPNHNTNSPEANDPGKAIMMGHIPPLPPDEAALDLAAQQGPRAPVEEPPPVWEDIVGANVPQINGVDISRLRTRTRYSVFASTASLFLLTAGLEYFGGKNFPSIFAYKWNPYANVVVSAVGGFFMMAATEGLMENMLEPQMRGSIETSSFRWLTFLSIQYPSFLLMNYMFSYRMIVVPALSFLELAVVRGVTDRNFYFSRDPFKILFSVLACAAATWKLLP